MTAACQIKVATLMNKRCSLDDVHPHHDNVHVYQLQACSNNPASNAPQVHPQAPSGAINLDGDDRVKTASLAVF
jgi:hypothetical protein